MEERFGRLILVRHLPGRKSLFQCDCGALKEIDRYNVRYGGASSCGCIKRETAAAEARRRTTHGMTNTPEYRAWNSMRERCRNPNHRFFEHYGARGISVCAEWDSFEAFYAAMGKRPDGFSLERIDNEKGYYPENCAWIPRPDQNRNRSDSVRLTYQGQQMILADLARITGVHATSIGRRLDAGMSPEEAVRAALVVRQARSGWRLRPR